MTLRRRLVCASVLVVLAISGTDFRAQDVEHPGFAGRLSPRPIDGRLAGQLTGIGEISAVLEGSELQIVGSFDGMQTPAVAASVRRGLNAGVAGASFGELQVSRGTSGLVFGAVNLDRSQIESLELGAIYVQIDGEGAEDGTLWGFLIRQ